MADYPEFTDAATLGEARAWLREQAQAEGAKCPCCTQFTRVYRRIITSAMARGLIAMWRDSPTDWFHMPTVLGHLAGDHAKLRYWGLIEEETVRRVDGGRAGWWRITEQGARFVKRAALVPRHALVFDGQLMRLDATDGHVSIADALGERFDYGALMAGTAPVAEPA